MDQRNVVMKDYKNSQWIKNCEESFAKQIYDITEDICKKRNVRVIRLFGPSCSGKTTTARHLISFFKRFGKRAHVISIDDFFYDREYLKELSEKKGLSDIDYDSPDTIDCDELGKFVEEIFCDDKVICPIFDFKTGMRSGYKTMNIDEDDIFIFEGIQAVYPRVVDMFKNHDSASIYILPQSDILAGGVCFESNEIRLMRRLVRDYNFRNTTPDCTFANWDSVRDNEEKNIFPYVGDSDYVVNSSMPYEIGVLKPYLVALLSDFDEGDPHYLVAKNIIDRVAKAEAIPSDLILDGYLYREFV